MVIPYSYEQHYNKVKLKVILTIANQANHISLAGLMLGKLSNHKWLAKKFGKWIESTISIKNFVC